MTFKYSMVSNAISLDDTELENLRIIFERLNRPEYFDWNLSGQKSLTKARNGKLISLDLSWHGIHSIPTNCFQGLEYLETVRLDNNHYIKFEKDAFGKTPKLTEIFLKFCHLTKFPKNAFTKGSRLFHIDVSHNPISQIKEGDFINLPSLQVLNLSNTKLSEISPYCFQGLYNLEELSLENNSLTAINDGDMGGLVTLQVLNLRNNHINKLGLQSFKGLDNVLEIRLDNNLLETIPNSTFQLTPSLEHVSLVNNQLTRLESIFANHPAITRIDLDTNLIEVVEKKNFQGSTKLKFVLLQSNLIKYVEEGCVEDIPGIQIINLENNPLEIEAALKLPTQAAFNYVPLIKSATQEQVHKWIVEHYENKRLVEQILRTKRIDEKTKAFLRLIGFYFRE